MAPNPHIKLFCLPLDLQHSNPPPPWPPRAFLRGLLFLSALLAETFFLAGEGGFRHSLRFRGNFLKPLMRWVGYAFAVSRRLSRYVLLVLKDVHV